MKVIEVDQVIDFSRYQLVDVRSPSEFAQGHIPGAVNVPLFFDEERHVIGCTYKDDGRPEAVLKGLEFVGPRMAELAKQGQQLAERGHLLLYCARGGMRSDSVGWLWERMGLGGQRLAGGYKTYRKWVLAQSSGSRTFLIIGGKTGSGKTELLHHLSGSGEQILDLEALAHHKGSVLGNLGQPPQPTQQQFENEMRLTYAREEARIPGKQLETDQAMYKAEADARAAMYKGASGYGTGGFRTDVRRDAAEAERLYTDAGEITNREVQAIGRMIYGTGLRA